MPLSRPSPSLQDYRSHLRLLGAWVNDLKALPIDAGRLDAEAHAIAQDLRECDRLLGADEAEMPDSAGLVPQDPVPAAYGWGARYVLEGSRLGGKMMYRSLVESLAPHPLTYLSGEGWVRDGNWRDFLALLRDELDSPVDIAAACDGARRAFSLLLQRCTAHAESP